MIWDDFQIYIFYTINVFSVGYTKYDPAVCNNTTITGNIEDVLGVQA